ncbi:hypothetical protein GGR52DRAFT_40733 [Hypoxylon sp. FL1284]|nr:hypothetical protein GGR52DRAFT_40733 [Hypoxylon sp. FL1284]
MAHYTKLDLKAFVLSSKDYDSVLSVTSAAFFSDMPSEYSPDELCQLILENQIWLISPGLCRIQITVDQSRLSMSPEATYISFLEYLADTICHCPLWATLGLTIKQEDIHLQPMYDGAPNIFFIVEHPHKASALLSPSHIPTACFIGIQCLFQCYPDNSQVPHAESKVPTTDRTNAASDSSQDAVETQALASADDAYGRAGIDAHIIQAQSEREGIAHLAQAAFYEIVGIRNFHHDLRLSPLEFGPSLLELAPAIWNAHYHKTVTLHAASFPMISSIIAASSHGRSSTLRKKSTDLLSDSSVADISTVNTETETKLNVYRNTAKCKLWDLVQTVLDPTIHTKNRNRGRTTHPRPDRLSNEPIRKKPRREDEYSQLNPNPPLNSLGNTSRSTGFSNDLDQYSLPQVYGLQIQYNDWNPDVETENMKFAYTDHAPRSNTTGDSSAYFPDSSSQSQSQNSFPSLSSFCSSSEELYDRPSSQEEKHEDISEFGTNIDDMYPPIL